MPCPQVKCVPYINPRLDATVYGSTVLDGTAPTTIATTTTATGADAAAAKARDRSSSSRRHSSYASTKRAERNSGAPAGSPAVTASAAVAPVARPYAGVPVTAHGTHAAVAALHASATAEARVCMHIRSVANVVHLLYLFISLLLFSYFENHFYRWSKKNDACKGSSVFNVPHFVFSLLISGSCHGESDCRQRCGCLGQSGITGKGVATEKKKEKKKAERRGNQ